MRGGMRVIWSRGGGLSREKLAVGGWIVEGQVWTVRGRSRWAVWAFSALVRRLWVEIAGGLPAPRPGKSQKKTRERIWLTD